MANLQEIRRRIASVQNTQKITRAMKLVAAAKVRRVQETLTTTRTHAEHLLGLPERLLSRNPEFSHPLMQDRKGKLVLLIVLTSDRGLCGSFYHTIVQEAAKWIQRERKEKDISVTLIGRKGAELFGRRHLTVHDKRTGLYDTEINFASVDLVNDYVQDFDEEHIDEVYCFYSRFESVVRQTVVLEKLLPCHFKPREDSFDPNWIIEPDENTLLTWLIRSNLFAQQHRIFHESIASEHGARMAAMESATINAGDVLSSLTLSYNRLRQDAITREVVEVISGASSQSQV